MKDRGPTTSTVADHPFGAMPGLSWTPVWVFGGLFAAWAAFLVSMVLLRIQS